MNSPYSRTLTLAVPSTHLEVANQLACLMGESAADIATFRSPAYTDGTTEYAVAHTVCKPVVTQALEAMTLPSDPEHVPEDYDRSKAEAGLEAIQEGVIRVAVDVDPHEQFAAWGLEMIPSDDGMSEVS